MLELILQIAAAVTAITIIVTGVVKLYKLIKKLDKTLGVDQEGQTAVERLEKKLDGHSEDVTRRLTRVEHQLFPNGGGSLVDKVNQVDRQVVEIAGQNEIVVGLLNSIINKK